MRNRRADPQQEDFMIWLATAVFGGVALAYVKVRRRRKGGGAVGH